MSEEIFEDTPESLFGAQEASAEAPGPIESAQENGVPAKRKAGRPTIGSRPMTQHERTTRSRTKARDKKNAKSYTYNSPQEPTKSEAHEILKGRGLTNNHVIKTVYGLLLEAAAANGVTPNRFMFANGISQALASYDAKEAKPLAEIPAEPVTGELLTRSELYSLYDASISWREELAFDGPDSFLFIRSVCKRDCFILGRDILQKDFAQVHRDWSDFAPKFNPDTLPPNYSQREAVNWLKSQSLTKNFLLMASRSMLKSSWSHIWALSLIVTYPDVRILLVSETRPLALSFIGVLRSYLEKTPGQESRFQNLFPEFVISPDEGSKLTIEVPMAHLHLAQSIEATSADSSYAGRRFDVGLMDDIISSTSCGNETQRAASVTKFDALCKLRESGAGLVFVIGTPWSHDDLYKRILERNEKDSNKPWEVRIDPAWTVKPEAQFKKLRDLEAEDVILRFPEKLDFAFLQSELRANEDFFMSQNLVIFPEEEDAQLKVTFSEEEIRARTVHMDYFAQSPLIEVGMAVDTAKTATRFSDYSAICTVQIRKHKGRTVAVVTDVVMERLKLSELAIEIVEAMQRNRPTRVVIERDGSWQDLADQIKRAALLRGFALPYIYWRTTNASGSGARQNIKAQRVKSLEPMIPNNELYFIASAIWNDAVIQQFVKFDGVTKSNSSRKDDAPDAIAVAVEQFFPRQSLDEDEDDVKRREEREQEEARARDAQNLRTYYEHMHGTSPLDTSTRASHWTGRPEPPPAPTPEETQQQKRTVVGGRFASLPSGFRQGRRT